MERGWKLLNITRTQITGTRIRARKVAGSYWMVYQLKDDERPDFVGNRSPIDMVPGKRAAIEYVKDLDDGPEGDELNG